ncbi:pilus assembly protein PilZ [Methylobacterium phyllosphaerae]
MGDERRVFSRGTALKTGHILFGSDQDFCDCLVWDLTRSGAMIEIGPETDLPAEFRLVSEGLYLNQPCRVIWRDGRKLGLKFAG